ncbi:R-phenyllactate CoA transferase domain protein [Mycobacterium xenopi 4042]|uniref:R-phenyllactate CoA transferase domain protein n=1 Tax=Mycobacterium xenopi 4042 TaxID=1299334 RepID=X8BJE8_MYCXE|nr:R-phenyllactate CoA transferase domain protein [Mycobacterium xenopi 4042]
MPRRGRTDWLTDPRFADGRARAANAVELIAQLDEIFATKPLDEWAETFASEPEFFWSPINSIEDMVVDPQFHAAGGLVDVPDPRGAVPMVATRPTSTAPRGHHDPPRHSSVSTLNKFSPSSKRAAVAHDTGFTDSSKTVTLCGPGHVSASFDDNAEGMR